MGDGNADDVYERDDFLDPHRRCPQCGEACWLKRCDCVEDCVYGEHEDG